MRLLTLSHLIQQQYFWLHTKSAKICAWIPHIALVNPYVFHSSYSSCTTDKQYTSMTALPLGPLYNAEYYTNTHAIVPLQYQSYLSSCIDVHRPNSPSSLLPAPANNVCTAKIPQPREDDAELFTLPHHQCSLPSLPWAVHFQKAIWTRLHANY